MMTEEEFDSMLARALTGNNEPQTEMHDLRTDTHACVKNNLAHGYSVFNADICHFETEPQTEREGE